jgi:predicted nuclease with TOPRIM domain
MGIRDVFKANKYKQEVESLKAESESKDREIESLEAQLTPEMRDVNKARKKVAELQGKASDLEADISAKESQVASLSKEVEEKRRQIVTYDDAILVQEFGLYEPRFDFADSSLFKDHLKNCRSQQKEEIRSFNASAKKSNWTVNGSSVKGRKMVSDTARLLMRAYNGECDEIVRKVKYTNVSASMAQVEKSAAAVSKLGSVMGISIPPEYVELKREEVQLAFEFAEQKQREKEALREAREQEREAAKLAKEIAEKRKTLEKERAKYRSAYEDVAKRLEAASDEERADLEQKAQELSEKLGDVDKAVKDVDYREANQRAGFVYVISNVGSLGQDVYKIGMTRRLEPMDRVNELGDASVPFNFDVHALIFCDDAPALEAALHRKFDSRKVNLVNQRREFFRVTLPEIEEVVKANYDKTVEFVEVPDAEQYRVSEKMREEGIFS